MWRRHKATKQEAVGTEEHQFRLKAPRENNLDYQRTHNLVTHQTKTQNKTSEDYIGYKTTNESWELSPSSHELVP